MYAENLNDQAGAVTDAESIADAEYLQTAASGTSRLAYYVSVIQSPEDLNFLQVGKTKKAWRRRITDADGDGVEDNVKFSAGELDEFYDPLVFGVAEDVHNTRHGNLPGHRQLEFTLSQGEPASHWQDIRQGSWATK